MYNPHARKELVYIHATKLEKVEVPDDWDRSPNPSSGCNECTNKRPVFQSEEVQHFQSIKSGSRL